MMMDGQNHMKKKAAGEALHELISHMMGLEGKKPEMPGEGIKAKMDESGMTGGPEQTALAGTPEDGSMDPDESAERKDFMSFKKRPIMEKSMTVVMAPQKMKKKMKGM